MTCFVFKNHEDYSEKLYIIMHSKGYWNTTLIMKMTTGRTFGCIEIDINAEVGNMTIIKKND